MFKTNKLILLFSTLLLLAILAGCSNENLDFDDDVSNIEVYKYDEETLVDTIEDEEFINDLLKELDKATTESTANMDYELPDYKLIFENHENEEMFNIGYFKEVMDLGVKGRYWDGNEDLMYKVDLELPLD